MVSYTMHMVKQSSSQKTKNPNSEHEAAATKFTLDVSAIAVISLVILAIVAMYA